jgi:hypothetical protein
MLIIFGDNQFIGVNHTGEKVEQYTEQFGSAEDIAVVLREAWKVGVRDFSFTVRPVTIDALNLVLADCPFNLHPAVPYAHTINETLTESGFVGLVRKYLNVESVLKMPIVFAQFLFNKYSVLWELYIKSELNRLPKENIKSIGMLNVCADFFLGAERYDILESFIITVRKKFNAVPVIYTMNFPMMANEIWKNDKYKTRIIFNYNELGFRMNPTKNCVLKTVVEYKEHDIGVMSIFSGMAKLDPIDYVKSDINIKSVTFGSASISRIKSNFELFNK